MWSVRDQRIPTPFTTNQGQLGQPGYIPSLDGVDGSFSERRRHGDFRIYHDSGDPDESELVPETRLIGRSVWNSEWMLIIPGAGLHADPDFGINQFVNSATDIKLLFMTYSHNGQ